MCTGRGDGGGRVGGVTLVRAGQEGEPVVNRCVGGCE